MAGALEGQTAIVTGAAAGIGRRIAETFAAEGAAVIVADLDGAAAEAVARAIAEQGGRAKAAAVDIRSESSLAAMVEATLAWTGRIDALVANAGVMVEGDALKITLADWQRALDVNATGTFLSVRAVLPHMLERGSGSLVLMASNVGIVGLKGTAAYAASKGAVVALTRQLAADFSGRGVRVNAIAPGAVRTALAEEMFRARAGHDEAAFNEALQRMVARYPMGRWGETDEIAQAALFLASPRSSWITGAIMPVDGGLTAVR